ncbi:MAG: MFS transporter [Candidatus Omnitrophica bacterium]|nr:MFS transporter [Candidatus Omnitrophota bacterium]
MLSFFSQFPYILFFGIFELFFSAPGQTFLISLFVQPIFESIHASQSGFAGLYSMATLAASLLLNPAGRLIDKHPTYKIILANAVLMAFGCFLLAGATSLTTLFIGFFLLRLMGQGVFGLTASTLIIKQFEKNRGKAMGIITLGFPFSELIYPSIALLLLHISDWRTSYMVFGLSNLVLMLPLQWWLIHKAKIKEGHFLPGESELLPQLLPGTGSRRKLKTRKDWTLGQCIKDVKFYILITASCVPPMVMTALLFHQAALFKSHHWPIVLAPTGLAVYAISKAFFSIAIGPVVDRYGPLMPFTVVIILIAAGTFVAGASGPVWFMFVYFAILGGALGMSTPIMNVVWPYFYGAKHIGSIKGFIGTIRNGLTALGPLPIAVALENGTSIHSIFLLIAVAILVMATFPAIIWRLDRD